MLKRSIMVAALLVPAAPAAAGWTLPCLFGGCSITFVSPEYAARHVQKLDPEKALAQINAFRTKYGRKPVVLDERLAQAAAMQSKDQADGARSVITGLTDRSPCNAPPAPAFMQRSPRRMSPQARNRSATPCAAGREARAIGRTCCVPR
jgi:hypothetical protein